VTRAERGRAPARLTGDGPLLGYVLIRPRPAADRRTGSKRLPTTPELGAKSRHLVKRRSDRAHEPGRSRSISHFISLLSFLSLHFDVMKRNGKMSSDGAPEEENMETEQVTCKYPGCEQAPARAGGTGRPPEYCENPEHTALKAWRERQRLAAEAGGVTLNDAETEQPVTMARASATEMLREMRALADRMAGLSDRVRQAADTVGDPTAAEAEMEALRTAAQERAAAAEAARAEAERRAAAADQMRALADAAAQEASEHATAASARVAEAQDQLARAITEHAADLEAVRAEAQDRIAEAQAAKDAALRQAEADVAAARQAAEDRIAQAERQAAELVSQAEAEAQSRVRAAEADRDQAHEQASQYQGAATDADRRATAAEARAEAARADASRAHEEGARLLEVARADAAREREELHQVMEARAATLEEARADLRTRAERAERELDLVRSGEAGERLARRAPRDKA
jgi:colicin import membrane protein